jgi:glycosyltransferase involved in cell wall biosynthesis
MLTLTRKKYPRLATHTSASSAPEQNLLGWNDVEPIRPLRTLFLLTSMPVGGAETLLVNLLRNLRSSHILPSVACLKEKGPLGELICNEFELSDHWLRSKHDFSVVWRLASYLRKERFDALVTVGAGDKMFWGRLAARAASLPVVCSALHSTGWPDGVGKLNRMLTPITDAFIAVANSHGNFLVDFERFPKSKVAVIPNGVDTQRFRPDREAYSAVRKELAFDPRTPIVGIVAALRHEKNHLMFVDAAKRVIEHKPYARFLIVGDGPERSRIEAAIASSNLQNQVLMLGTRHDTPRLLSAMNAFALTSHNEASPVSILEALACEVPVVATRVGSVSESVFDQWNGFTVEAGRPNEVADKLLELISNPTTAGQMGRNGREHVEQKGSLQNMVRMYEELLHRIYNRKQASRGMTPAILSHN